MKEVLDRPRQDVMKARNLSPATNGITRMRGSQPIPILTSGKKKK